MIITMEPGATEEQIQFVITRVRECGYQAHVGRGVEYTTIGAVGTGGNRAQLESLQRVPGVLKIIPISDPYKLVGIQVKSTKTVVDVKGVLIGGPTFVVIAGPCSVESRAQVTEAAVAAKSAGADLFRGGAYKPRTSPYDFQGLGLEGLKLLAEAREKTQLPIVTEVLSTDDIGVVQEYADMIQVGARNMQNFDLLRRLAKISTPIILKRGPSATIKEWLLAAEYLLVGGNSNVVLCERGIKTFEPELRNTLDLAAVVRVSELSHLPVIVDPSHATGRKSIVPAAARAAAAIGADGVMLELHPNPQKALSDGPQALNPADFALLMQDLRSYWSRKSPDVTSPI
jgi:3-deoxy-7-phosphoheptulonate synthase